MSFKGNKKFLSQSFSSKRHFIDEYEANYCDKNKAKKLYLEIVHQLVELTKKDCLKNFEKMCTLLHYISNVESQETLNEYFDDEDNLLKNSNLVIMACKYNSVEILKHIFDNSEVFNLLSTSINRNAVRPDDTDEMCHNAFYYAILSGNIDLLKLLINGWPDNYFAVNLEELDAILSRAYEELKLKRVPLSQNMEVFIEDKLIDIRFFANSRGQDKIVLNDINTIMERIELLLDSIRLLIKEYANSEVDDKFLFVSKFIARNIHILKQQLKWTYDTIPWEEMEFCLICFAVSHSSLQEINLFYNTVLNKRKILSHLENFLNQLDKIKCFLSDVPVGKLSCLPNLKRERVVADIIRNCPPFEELYDDHKVVRDIYSLREMLDCVTLALSADPKDKNGQLVIIRALQVVGESLKNTLESPKLSNATCERLIVSLPKNTREVVISLRNSLSHVCSPTRRSEIKENSNASFFAGVQNDAKKIGEVVTEFLFQTKMKTIKSLLHRIVVCEKREEIEEVVLPLKSSKMELLSLDNFMLKEHEKLKNLIKELSGYVAKKTDYEIGIFKEIDRILNPSETESKQIQISYTKGFAALMCVCITLGGNDMDTDVVSFLKLKAKEALTNIAPSVETQKLKNVAELSMKIIYSFNFRMHLGNQDEVQRLICRISMLTGFEMKEIKVITRFGETLNAKNSPLSPQKSKRNINETEVKYKNQLEIKVSELRNVLLKYQLDEKIVENFFTYLDNKNIQAVVEMLVLDVVSILSSRKYLTKNIFFSDDCTPLLTGKCLRNHLAHGNALVNVLLSDPSLAILSNAKKLVDEGVSIGKKKVGKSTCDDPFNQKKKFHQDLVTLTNQDRMFAAVEEGNLKDLERFLEQGADINGKNINSWTTMHFAAKGTSLEMIEFTLKHVSDASAEDVNGDNPLHFAAKHGRTAIVDLLLKKTSLKVNAVNFHLKTPLHLAALYGHRDSVEVLLKFKADALAEDIRGVIPLQYAIQNDNVDVVELLLTEDANVEFVGGSCPLLEAAEMGYLKLCNYLLQKKADVNAKNDRGWTALHAASFNGHLEIVQELVLRGACVRAQLIHGSTALHYAAQSGHEAIADFLLRHGAEVDAVDKSCINTPLHYAANAGYDGVVATLLKFKANVNAKSLGQFTPLHLAVDSGHLGIVMALLEHGADVNAENASKCSPLHLATQSGHRDIVDFLIQSKANVNGKIVNDSTPLHLACVRGHADIADLLIKANGNVYAEDVLGNAPLHYAAENGSIDVLSVLLRNEADVHARNYAGMTAMHLAAHNIRKDAILCLIKNKAQVNVVSSSGFTPLHAAVSRGDKEIVDALIENGAQVDARDIEGETPFHIAVVYGYTGIVEILAANGADVNAIGRNGLSALLTAIKNNNKSLVEVLIAKGADVNEGNGEALRLAVVAGCKDILDVLLKNGASVDTKEIENITLLHLAAARGHREIARSLISKGAVVDAVRTNKETPLHCACEEGYDDVAEVLISSGADVNVKCIYGLTPLHLAAVNGHSEVVKLLLKNDADVLVKEIEGRTALEFAVGSGHLETVRVLTLDDKQGLTTKENKHWSLLHIASDSGHLMIIEYLVDAGMDIKTRNSLGSMAAHIAAREGYRDIVEFFLKKGVTVDEPGGSNQTMLHYAVMKDHLDILKYLIGHGANVNAQDTSGLSPLHLAAFFSHYAIAEELLKNGAFYDASDSLSRKVRSFACDRRILKLFDITESLFDAVKQNRASEVERCIENGAIVNAKSTSCCTSLHLAASKGCDVILDILLLNDAELNAVDDKGCTPLHYAAQFSHIKIVKTLLSAGAMYEALSLSGKTPLDLAKDRKVLNLLKLVSDSFKHVKKGNLRVVSDLNNMMDVEVVKAVINTRNRENQTLVVTAIHHHFPNVDQLKEMFQGDVLNEVRLALMYHNEARYSEALVILDSVYAKRKALFGPDNPATLDIQSYRANTLFTQGLYSEALIVIKEVFHKRKQMFGLKNVDVLKAGSMFALVLHNLGENEEALRTFREVYELQEKMLGPDDPDSLDTHFHMALVLNVLGKFEEALKINKAYFEKKRKVVGDNDPSVILAQNNIAMVLCNQEKLKESLTMYKEVLKKKKTAFGNTHFTTLRTQYNIAEVLLRLKNNSEALKNFQEVLSIQEKVLPPNHPDILLTRHSIGNVLFSERKTIGAFKIYREIFDKMKATLGPSHPNVLDVSSKLEQLNFIIESEFSDATQLLQLMQTDLIIAAASGTQRTVLRLLKNGVDANDKDADGRTALHYAVDRGHADVVKSLLEYGADVLKVTNKGNTVLHTAVVKNSTDVLEVLLERVDHGDKHDFINAKTTVGGMTALHVAAKNGYLEAVTALLKHGASYCIENRKGETPFDLSSDQKVKGILKLIRGLFRSINSEGNSVINRLGQLSSCEFEAAVNARDGDGNTLLQVAISKKRLGIASELAKMLKRGPIP